MFLLNIPGCGTNLRVGIAGLARNHSTRMRPFEQRGCLSVVVNCLPVSDQQAICYTPNVDSFTDFKVTQTKLKLLPPSLLGAC